MRDAVVKVADWLSLGQLSTLAQTCRALNAQLFACLRQRVLDQPWIAMIPVVTKWHTWQQASTAQLADLAQRGGVLCMIDAQRANCDFGPHVMYRYDLQEREQRLLDYDSGQLVACIVMPQ